MLTEEEKNALVGDGNDAGKEAVDREEYEKLAQQYANMRSLESRRDTELHELREKVKAYESRPATSADGEDRDEDAEFLTKLQKYGFKPRSEDEIRAEVRKTMTLEEKTKEIIKDVSEITRKYDFAEESELVSFLGRNPKFSYEKALKALYPDEMYAIAKGEKATESIVETDRGGRTISTSSVQTSDGGATPKRGLPPGTDLAGWLSSRISKYIDEAAGTR